MDYDLIVLIYWIHSFGGITTLQLMRRPKLQCGT